MTDRALIASVWPDWEAAEEIGQGTFGTVYAVRRRDIPQMEAAVKVIPVPTDDRELESLRYEGFSDKEIEAYTDRMAQDWYNEIRMMNKYQGMSHFVSMEDCKIIPRTDGRPGKWILIRMEKLKSFNTYLSDKRLTEAEVIELGRQLCRALAACHADGILHRDIKPENIFVNDRFSSGVLYKLGDFGVSREFGQSLRSLSVKGTMPYMAPEIFRGAPYDQRADIYALGLTMYRLLNGNRLPFLPARQLFTHEDHAVALRMRLSGMALPPAADASAGLDRVLQKACAFDPAQRYQTADEFAAALEKLAAGKGAAADQRRLRPRLLWAAAGLAAAALLAAALLLPKGGAGTPPQATQPPMLTVVDKRK